MLGSSSLAACASKFLQRSTAAAVSVRLARAGGQAARCPVRAQCTQPRAARAPRLDHGCRGAGARARARARCTAARTPGCAARRGAARVRGEPLRPVAAGGRRARREDGREGGASRSVVLAGGHDEDAALRGVRNAGGARPVAAVPPGSVRALPGRPRGRRLRRVGAPWLAAASFCSGCSAWPSRKLRAPARTCGAGADARSRVRSPAGPARGRERAARRAAPRNAPLGQHP